MRTTLDLDGTLLKAARSRAAKTGTSLTAVIEEALSVLLAPRPTRREAFRLRLKTDRGTFVGGADVADRDALYEAMEGRR